MADESYTKAERSANEGDKLLYDTLKHLTTLSTGTIVILATFLEKLFSQPIHKSALVASFVGLVISLVFAFISMFFAANRVYYTHSPDEVSNKILKWTLLISVVSFLLSIIFFTNFSLVNFNA